MRRKSLAAFLTLILSIAFALAGTAARAQLFTPEPEADPDMVTSKSRKNMRDSGVQYGAWVTPYIIYQEAPGGNFSTSVNTFRAWFKTYLWDNSFLYVRGKDTYTAVIKKGGSGVRNKNVLDLDIGYISMATPRRNLDFSVGRKYYNIGSGLVLNGRGDGAELNFYSKYINVKALGSWTGFLVKDDNPYGLSDRDLATGSRRVFGGGEISTEWFNQKLYVFGMAQFDFGRERYDRRRRQLTALMGWTEGFSYYSGRSRYDSQYYGVGLRGVIVSGLSYSGEAVMERGKSYLSGLTLSQYLPGYNLKSDILAYSAQFKLDYYINTMFTPVLGARYAFGSGDVNRDDYRTPIGNSLGKDRGFIYFGTFVGGYAFKPLLANMHVISGSVAVSPFSWSDVIFVNAMTLTARYFYYMKHKTMATVNYGLDATKHEREIGHGLDASLRWRLFSDLTLSVTYGLFIPGKAFGYAYDWTLRTVTSSRTTYRHFFMGGFNVTF
ncbi:MAG: alginate export family protein [Spirochaetes bacterium]|nr:alginate export family protein [Spirochaetota bacterium]